MLTANMARKGNTTKKTSLSLLLLPLLTLMLVLIMAACTKENEPTGGLEMQLKFQADEEIVFREAPEQYISEALILDNLENIIAIHYSNWFNAVLPESGEPSNITHILNEAADTGKAPDWGPLHAFHYWAEPAVGYYRSDNTDVIRTHMQQLYTAYVDFLIIDHTNANSGWKDTPYIDRIFRDSTRAMLDTMLEMRNSGQPTPHIVFWVGSGSVDAAPDWAALDVYEHFYRDGRYRELFVEFEGKPLLLTTDLQPETVRELFTTRKMWGLQGRLQEKEWSFLQSPQQPSMNGGQPEQLSVITAMQRDYMSNALTAVPRKGGRTFAEQWQTAFELRPKIVTITWWNEWAAQRFEDERGNSRFVDNYTLEYSRDIEPMKGGHGDQYYRWLIEYAYAYKEGKPFPEGLIAVPGPLDSYTLDAGSFETGVDRWQAGSGAEQLRAIAGGEQDSPAASAGKRMLAITATAKASELALTFDAPLDLRAYDRLSAQIYVSGDAPASASESESTSKSTSVSTSATDYGSAQLSLVFADGSTAEQQFTLTEGWNNVSFAWETSPALERVQAIGIAWTRADKQRAVWYIDQVQMQADYALQLASPILALQAGSGGSASVQVEVEGLRPSRAAFKLTEGLAYEIADPAIAAVDSAGKLTALSGGETVLTIRDGDKVLRVPVLVQAEAPAPIAAGDALLLGQFEGGSMDGWLAGEYVAEARAAEGNPEASVPDAHAGQGMLEAASGPYPGQAWKGVSRSLPSADLSAYSSINFAVSGWGGAPGATEYRTRLKLVAGNGERFEEELVMQGGWNLYNVDISGWEDRHEVTSIEIGFQAVGGEADWAGKYFIDDVFAQR